MLRAPLKHLAVIPAWRGVESGGLAVCRKWWMGWPRVERPDPDSIPTTSVEAKYVGLDISRLS